MRYVAVMTLCLTVLPSGLLFAEHPASAELLAFRFIEKAFLGYDEPATKNLLSTSQQLVDGKKFSIAEILKSLRHQHENDDRITRSVDSVFFVRTREDLKGVFEYWVAQHAERAGKNVRKTEQGEVDVEKTCAKWKVLLEEKKDFVKCIFGIRTGPKTGDGPSEVRFMFLLCEKIDGKWLVTGVDDG